jgi:flavin reductase (DIM6/NTAB) family NADH-FMN oxidoreductase RutF
MELSNVLVNLSSTLQLRNLPMQPTGAVVARVRKFNKWEECHLTPGQASVVKAPIIEESPVNIECGLKKSFH